MANHEPRESSHNPTGDRLTVKIAVLPVREYHAAGCDAPGCPDPIEFRIAGSGGIRPYRTCRKHIAMAARHLIRQQFGEQREVDLAALLNAERQEMGVKMAAILAEIPLLPTPDLAALRKRLAKVVGGEWSPALGQLRQAIDEELSRRGTQFHE